MPNLAALPAGIPALGIPGVDLPARAADPVVARPAPWVVADAVTPVTAATPVPVTVVGHLDDQHRVRCRRVIDELGWDRDTVLVAHTDRHTQQGWLQAAPPPCPHHGCRHDHAAPALPGTPDRLDLPARQAGQVYGDAVRLRVPAGLAAWVGTHAEHDVVLVARPDLDAVQVTSPATVASILTALLTTTATTTVDNVVHLADRKAHP